jgi:hypothetical protein
MTHAEWVRLFPGEQADENPPCRQRERPAAKFPPASSFHLGDAPVDVVERRHPSRIASASAKLVGDDEYDLWAERGE